MKSKEICL